MKPHLARFYLGEVKRHCDWALSEAARLLGSGEVDEEHAPAAAHQFLGHTSIISRFLRAEDAPRGSFLRRRDRNRRRARARAEALRSLLDLAPSHPLLNPVLRDCLTRVDEQVDRWADEDFDSIIVRDYERDYLRYWDPETAQFQFRNVRFDLRQLADHVRTLREAVQARIAELDRNLLPAGA